MYQKSRVACAWSFGRKRCADLVLDMEGAKPGDDIHVGWEHAMSVLITPYCLSFVAQPVGPPWCEILLLLSTPSIQGLS